MISSMENRLIRWGEWLAGGMGGGGSGMSTMHPLPRGNYRTTVVPRVDIEASRIQDWVRTCDPDGQKLLALVYVQCETVTSVSVRLDVSRTTVYARLHRLQSSLAAYLQQRREK